MNNRQEEDKIFRCIGVVMVLISMWGCYSGVRESVFGKRVILRRIEAVGGEKMESMRRELSYDSIVVGYQVWMKNNLDVTHFRNGDEIPEAKSEEEWRRAAEEGCPAWCYYENNEENGKKYGKMYNWYAVMDPRGLAPEGWRIATYEDYKALGDYLRGHGLDVEALMKVERDGEGVVWDSIPLIEPTCDVFDDSISYVKVFYNVLDFGISAGNGRDLLGGFMRRDGPGFIYLWTSSVWLSEPWTLESGYVIVRKPLALMVHFGPGEGAGILPLPPGIGGYVRCVRDK